MPAIVSDLPQRVELSDRRNREIQISRIAIVLGTRLKSLAKRLEQPELKFTPDISGASRSRTFTRPRE